MAKNRAPMASRPHSFGNRSHGQSTPIEISKSPQSKNLAHVPCKFFRQGTCQAGSSCPFAHTMDTTVNVAPCKYFQKGNCKFGVKCALAHILPDGRRVNPTSLQHAYQHHSKNKSNKDHLNTQSHSVGNGNGYLSQSATVNSSYYSSSPQNITSPQQQNSGFSHYEYAVNQKTSPIYNSPFIGNTVSSYSSHSLLYGSTSPSQPRATSMSEQQRPSNFASTSIWSNYASNTDTTSGNLQFHSSRSGSHSASFRPIFNSCTSQELGSSIADDDEDDMFEEDYVPSSLSDLLTPQELQRRGSRPTGSRSLAVAQLQKPLEVDGVGKTSNEAVIDGSEMQFRMDEDEFLLVN